MSRETYIIRIAKSPWSNFYFAAEAAAATVHIGFKWPKPAKNKLT